MGDVANVVAIDKGLAYAKENLPRQNKWRVERMNATIAPAGFNVLNNMGRAAWQSIFHFHVHVIPRYADDPLQLPWVPEPAEADELATVAAQLRG